MSILKDIFPTPVPLDEFKKRNGIIYRIVNLTNGKTYVGKTLGCFNYRYRSGKWWKWTSNKSLLEDVQLLGKDLFSVDIMAYDMNDEELTELEEFLMWSTNSLHPNGYNMVDTSHHATDETRRRMSIAGKERMKKFTNPFQGKKHSIETREHLRQINTGKTLSEEHKQKIKDAAPRGENHAHFGKKMSEERKRLLAATRVPNGRRVQQIDPPTNEVVAEFSSLKAAYETTGFPAQNIGRSCRTRFTRKLKAGGFLWKYTDETP